MTTQPTSFLEKAIPSLPRGFSANPNDPWGHEMGDVTASQFAEYYGPELTSGSQLKDDGLIDAYLEFASAKSHKKSDYVTISLVRLESDSQAAALTSRLEEDLTRSITPAPGGGSVYAVSVPGIPGSEAYQSWFEGSASFDIVFAKGGVVAEIDRTSPSTTTAAQFQKFAEELYARLTQSGDARIT